MSKNSRNSNSSLSSSSSSAGNAKLPKVVAAIKLAFHAYHHQEIIHTSYVPILVDRLQLHYRYDKAKRDECDHWRD